MSWVHNKVTKLFHRMYNISTKSQIHSSIWVGQDRILNHKFIEVSSFCKTSLKQKQDLNFGLSNEMDKHASQVT